MEDDLLTTAQSLTKTRVCVRHARPHHAAAAGIVMLLTSPASAVWSNWVFVRP